MSSGKRGTHSRGEILARALGCHFIQFSPGRQFSGELAVVQFASRLAHDAREIPRPAVKTRGFGMTPLNEEGAVFNKLHHNPLEMAAAADLRQ